MVLNKPSLELENVEEADEYPPFDKNKFYCLDGFPKEGNPCVTVIPSPVKEGVGVYMGIKPTVLVLNDE